MSRRGRSRLSEQFICARSSRFSSPNLDSVVSQLESGIPAESRFTAGCSPRRLRCVTSLIRHGAFFHSAFFLWAFVCLLAEPRSADGWELSHSLMKGGKLEVMVTEGPLAERCRAAAKLLAARTGLELVLIAPGEASDLSRPRIVLGTWETPGIESLTDAIGITRREQVGFLFDGQPYARPGDALVAWFEDPERPDLPVALYFSEELDDLIPIITDFMPASVPSVLCYHGGDICFESGLSGRGLPAPRADFSTWSSWTKYRENATGVWGPSVHSQLSPDVDPERHLAYQAQVVAARTRAARWLGLTKEQLSLRLRFHAQFEDLRWLSRGAALAVPNLERPGAQVLLAPGVPDDGGVAAIYALATKALGPPVEVWVGEGLSVAAAGHWWGRKLEVQLGRIGSADIALSPAELIDPEADQIYSPHLLAPLRALLFSVAIETEDPGRALELWTGTKPLDVTDGALLAAYESRLSAAAGAFTSPDRVLDMTRYRAGVALEAERISGLRDGFASGNYGSRAADAVLDQASSFGANAVVLSTNAFMESESPRRPDPPLALRRRATVSDAALAAAVGKAHSLSMEVLLQPHLLTSPTGILAGRQAWSGQASIERFLFEYERFIEHYALLSDLLGIEILCFGSELVGAMDFVPDPRRKNVNLELIDEKRNRWISMIDRVRACYDGGLTYAVRSSFNGYSIGVFELWSYFDFVSAALFEPVDRKTWNVTNNFKHLEKQVTAMVRKARRVEKPLFILPIGYPASLNAAINPRLPGREDEGVALERQNRLYKALGQVLSGARERGELTGAYLWKFSTNPLRTGSADSGFSPLGKPAEQWLPLVFGK